MPRGPIANVELRERIVALAQRHRRYGVGMIHLKLRQGSEVVNDKRVERLYREAKLQVRRRKRKKVCQTRASIARSRSPSWTTTRSCSLIFFDLK
jgi:uncharacterized membrane protein